MKNRGPTVEEIKIIARNASKKAIEKTLKAGGAITFQRGKYIIKQYADGTEYILEVLDKAYLKSKNK
jgi:ribosomal protein L18E